MPVCFCTGNSTLSRNVTNRKYYKKYRKPRRRATARREPRCSYTATIGTAFHIQHRAYRQKSIKSHRPQSKHSPPYRHSAPHPTSKNTKTSQHGHTSPQPRNFQKKPEGCAEGPWLYGPFAVFHSFSKQKNHAFCQEKQNIHHIGTT